jgi:hypothetical protein
MGAPITGKRRGLASAPGKAIWFFPQNKGLARASIRVKHRAAFRHSLFTL